MARESKVEVAVRESITSHLHPNEILHEFTWGARESNSVAYFFFGAIGTALAKRDQLGYYIGLTDKRAILVKTKGNIPTGEVVSISTDDIKGISYKRGLSSGILSIHLSADTLTLHFDNKPWYPRAQKMAKLLPLQR